MEQLLSIKDVASRLAVHPSTARLLVRAGKIKAIALPSVGAAKQPHVRVRESDLEAYLAGLACLPPVGDR